MKIYFVCVCTSVGASVSSVLMLLALFFKSFYVITCVCIYLFVRLKFSFIPFRSISILICSLDSSNFHVPSQYWWYYLKTSKQERTTTKNLRSFDKQNRFFLRKKQEQKTIQFWFWFFWGTISSYSLHTHYIIWCFVLL